MLNKLTWGGASGGQVWFCEGSRMIQDDHLCLAGGLIAPNTYFGTMISNDFQGVEATNQIRVFANTGGYSHLISASFKPNGTIADTVRNEWLISRAGSQPLPGGDMEYTTIYHSIPTWVAYVLGCPLGPKSVRNKPLGFNHWDDDIRIPSSLLWDDHGTYEQTTYPNQWFTNIPYMNGIYVSTPIPE